MSKILDIINKILDIILNRDRAKKVEGELAHQKWREETIKKIDETKTGEPGIDFNNPWGTGVK